MERPNPGSRKSFFQRLGGVFPGRHSDAIEAELDKLMVEADKQRIADKMRLVLAPRRGGASTILKAKRPPVGRTAAEREAKRVRRHLMAQRRATKLVRAHGRQTFTPRRDRVKRPWKAAA